MVLVAALVVPLSVIPGTFGFQSWPSSHGKQVTDQRVHEGPHVKVVTVRAERATNARRGLAEATPRRRGTASTSKTTSRRQSAAVVSTPGRSGSTGDGPGRSGSGRHGSGTNGTGRGTGSTPPAAGSPAAPSTPSSEPEQPSTGPLPDPGQIAGGATPVLRGEPVPATPPPPAPVVPVTPVVASPPAPEDDGDGYDHGDRPRASVHDVVHGLGLGRRHGPGHGHDGRE